MKVHKIICPECSSSLTSKAGIEEGTSINCPKCNNKFAVAAVEAEEEVVEDFEVLDDEDEEEEKPKKPAAKSGLKPLSKQRKAQDEEDEDENESRRKPASRQRNEEDEEEERPKKQAAKSGLKPLSKRNRSEDDEEDERPRKASRALSNRDADDDDETPRSKRKSRVLDDDDDERPRSKRRNRDEDDDDDEPKSAYGKLKSNVYVRASVLGVLLIVMGVLGFLLYDKFSKKNDDGGSSAKNDDDDPSKPNPKYVSGPRPTTAPKSKTPAPKVNDPELRKFQGNWRPVSMTVAGVAAPQQQLAQFVLTIQNNEMTISVAPGDVNTFRVDPSKSPAEIDSTDKSNKVEKGIYRFINPTTLEICMSQTDERPKSFVSNKENPYMLMRLQKIP